MPVLYEDAQTRMAFDTKAGDGLCRFFDPGTTSGMGLAFIASGDQHVHRSKPLRKLCGRPTRLVRVLQTPDATYPDLPRSTPIAYSHRRYAQTRCDAVGASVPRCACRRVGKRCMRRVRGIFAA